MFENNTKNTLPSTSRYAWEKLPQRPATSHQFPERKFPNPFFIRNNPHPTKVRHIKGLLDFPICSVEHLTVENNQRRNVVKKVEFQRELQKLRNKEKFVPGIGLVQLNCPWMDELAHITKQLKLQNVAVTSPRPFNDYGDGDYKTHEQSRCSSRQISRQSERSNSRQSVRTCSRQMSRQVNKSVRSNPMISIQEDYVRSFCAMKNDSDRKAIPIHNPENHELYVMTLLSQILNTNALAEIKYWLANAPNTEKEVVLEMLNAIIASKTAEENDRLNPNNEMSSLKGNVNEPSFNQDFLYHECSLNADEIKDFLQKQKLTKETSSNSDIITNVNLIKDTEIEASEKRINSRNSFIKDVVPLFKDNSQEELEEIRKMIATRSGREDDKQR